MGWNQSVALAIQYNINVVVSKHLVKLKDSMSAKVVCVKIEIKQAYHRTRVIKTKTGNLPVVINWKSILKGACPHLSIAF